MDIKQATGYAKSMITKFGMSENLGLICYGDEGEEVFIGRDLAHARGYADSTAAKIDEEVKKVVDDCYVKAKDIINKNMEILHSCAKLLIEKEKITQEEFEALFDSNEDIDA